VATVKALKLNGGQALSDLATENLDALKKGIANLVHHIKSMAQYGVPVVVAINRFTQDTNHEIDYVKQICADMGIQALDTDVWAKGGHGALDLAKTIIKTVEKPATFKPLYEPDADLTVKIETIVTKIYGGVHVEYSKKAINQIKRFKKYGWDKLPVCMAKTQYSLSDDPKLLGAPKDFTIHVKSFVPKLGAGFIVAMTGNILTMPGLPKHPAALDIDISDDGKISGLF